MPDLPPAAKRSVLVLDDNHEFGHLLTEGLRRAGHVAWQADTAAEALRILGGETVDVLLTDIVMPGCDGIELIQQVRKRWPQIRILAMSGGTPHSALYLDIGRKLGATETLKKPFSLERLLSAVA